MKKNYLKDAKNVFNILKNGGIAIVYMRNAYAIISGTDKALKKVYKSKKRDFIEGAKWQAEKMYSEEDLIELLQNCWSESAINLAQQTNKEEYITFSEWIEKNL